MHREINTSDISIEFIDKMGTDKSVVNAAKVSFNKRDDNQEITQADKGLLAYLATGLPSNEREDWEKRAHASQHWSPFAHCSLTVRCKAPLFLARQLVKHQVGLSWNEESRRYIKSDIELYIPDVVHKTPENAKQGASKEAHTGYVWHEHSEHDTWPQYGVDTSAIDVIKYASEQNVKTYYELLHNGVAPEEARMVLPLNSMTNWIWSGSLMAFARVYKQRSDGHAQNAAQEFADKLGAILYEHFPHSMQALNS